MSIPLLIELRDIQLAAGAQRADQLFTSRGSGRADAALVDDLLRVGSDEAAGLLAPGFTPDEIVGLARRDAAIRRKIAFLALGMCAQGRPEFTGPNGEFVFAKPFADAKKDLEKLGEKDKRSVAEQQNGTINRMTGARVGQRGYRPERRFTFADTRYHRGSGGF